MTYRQTPAEHYHAAMRVLTKTIRSLTTGCCIWAVKIASKVFFKINESDEHANVQ